MTPQSNLSGKQLELWNYLKQFPLGTELSCNSISKDLGWVSGSVHSAMHGGDKKGGLIAKGYPMEYFKLGREAYWRVTESIASNPDSPKPFDPLQYARPVFDAVKELTAEQRTKVFQIVGML